MDADRVMAVLRALERANARFKVVGGVALNLHGIVRSTEDLDLFVDPEPDDVRRVVGALRQVFGDPQPDEIHPDAPALPSSRTAWERMREVLAVAARLRAPHFPPGVHKSRSIAEANARREACASAPE